MPAPRTDARGSMVSTTTTRLTFRVVGWDALQRALRALGELGSAGDMSAIVGTDIIEPPYPYYLEFGTSRMPAYPSARPAFDQMNKTAVNMTGDVIGQMVTSGVYDPHRIMPPALREGARPIENRWKELARYDTGAYRRSIHTVIV